MLVYIIIDNNKYDVDRVKKELKAEGYKHSFFISWGHDIATKIKAMDKADEVWCFGQCYHTYDYKMARESRKDIWNMG